MWHNIARASLRLQACVTAGTIKLNESLNSRFHDQCLHLEWLRHRSASRIVTKQWRRHYNE